MANKNNLTLHLFDKDWISKLNQIKTDPYRYILSEREYKQCYNRPKRAVFSGVITGAYLYYSIRHKQELGLIRGFKMGQVFFLTTLPKAILIGAISYLIGFSLLVDYNKKKCHNIAKIELMKFDESHFDRNNFHYTLINTPIYSNENSKFGRKKILRNFLSYEHQLPGYILRIRERNPDVEKDVPPKYDFSAEGKRKIDETKVNFIRKALKF